MWKLLKSLLIVPKVKLNHLSNKANLNPQLKFHSLRHTFASWLVQNGVSIYTVSKLMGHSQIQTTQIYSHLRMADYENSVKQLEQLFK